MGKQDETHRQRTLTTRIRGHLRSNVVGYLALFVALSGSAYAASKIGPNDISKNAVRSKHIKNGQVKGPDINARSVASRLGVVASGNIVLPATTPPTERVLARSGPIRLVARCSSPGSAQSQIFLRSTGATGAVEGVVYGFSGFGEIDTSFSTGTGYSIAGAASGAIGPNGASFIATVGDSAVSGELRAGFVDQNQCTASFQGFVG